MNNNELDEMIEKVEILKDKLAEGIERLEKKVELVSQLYNIKEGEE